MLTVSKNSIKFLSAIWLVGRKLTLHCTELWGHTPTVLYNSTHRESIQCPNLNSSQSATIYCITTMSQESRQRTAERGTTIPAERTTLPPRFVYHQAQHLCCTRGQCSSCEKRPLLSLPRNECQRVIMTSTQTLISSAQPKGYWGTKKYYF